MHWKMALLQDVKAAMGALVAIHNDEVTALLVEDFDKMAELQTKLSALRAHQCLWPDWCGIFRCRWRRKGDG